MFIVFLLYFESFQHNSQLFNNQQEASDFIFLCHGITLNSFLSKTDDIQRKMRTTVIKDNILNKNIMEYLKNKLTHQKSLKMAHLLLSILKSSRLIQQLEQAYKIKNICNLKYSKISNIIMSQIIVYLNLKILFQLVRNILSNFLYQSQYKQSMIKNEEQYEFRHQVKVLSKQFKFIEQYYIRILYEFCEYEFQRTYKILMMLKEDPNPLIFIKCLVENPKVSEKAIIDMEKRHNIKYPNFVNPITQPIMEEYQIDDNSQQTKINQQEGFLQYDFFQLVPPDVCLKIMGYLDPLSFSKISCVNSHFYKFSKNEQAQQYFRMLCMGRFQYNEPKLPLNCLFEEIKHFVLTHPLEFGQNFMNAVNNNLRYFVWKMESASFKVQNYRSLFIHCPRINYNGYYICRQRYVKIGQKNYTNPITPIHIIYFYRYMRFFEDGSLLYYVSSKKHKSQQIIQRLSSQQRNDFDPDNKNEVMIGQFMEYKDKVYLKTVKKNTIFSFEMNMVSTENKICNKLNILKYTLEMVDQKQIVQVLFLNKPFKEQLYFSYIACPEFQFENNQQRAICGI